MAPQKGLISDVVVYLPSEKVARSAGFSVDIGTSVAKLLFRSNKDYKNGVPIKKLEDPTKGIVHYAKFPRGDIDGVVKYLHENTDFTRNSDGLAVVQCSGVGASSFKKLLESGLKAKISVQSEFECFVKAFLALTKMYTKEELCHAPSAKTQAQTDALKAVMQHLVAKVQSFGEHGHIQFGTGTEEQKVETGANPYLPCLLFMCGSASGVFKIETNGTYKLFEGPFAGGRVFHGLASWLGGTNDFKEIMEVASKGDGRTADIYFSDLTQNAEEGEEENLYNSYQADVLAFPCGKLSDQDPSAVKKEDLLYSLYHVVAGLHVQHAYLLCELNNVKTAYFCGNLFDHELGRDLLLTRKGMRDSYTPPANHYDMEFIKNGGMLGVVGAFMWKDKPAAEAEAEAEPAADAATSGGVMHSTNL